MDSLTRFNGRQVETWPHDQANAGTARHGFGLGGIATENVNGDTY